MFPDSVTLLENGRKLQLEGLNYKTMAGTYHCTAETEGGQNSATSELIVYCE